MALGAQHDFSMHSGDDLVLEVTVKDAAGTVVDISGASGTFGIGKLDSSGNPKGSSLAAPAVAITDGAAGKLSVTIVPANTESLAGDYWHELQLTDAATKISTVLYGTLTVQKDLVV